MLGENPFKVDSKQFKQEYLIRRHDIEVHALVDTRRRGNYLLVGRSGSGKAASLRALSDRLIDAGTEHQIIPAPREGGFLPPPAKINLVDDLNALFVYEPNCHRLMDQLNASRSRSLNIITACRPEMEQLEKVLRIDGTISIPIPSRSEIREYFEIILARDAASKGYDTTLFEIVRDQIEMGGVRDFFELAFFANVLQEKIDGIKYIKKISDSNLEVIRPKLITLQTTILQNIRARPIELTRLSPVEFERLIGELFEKEGYSVEFTKASRDGGVDLFAWKRDISGESLTIVQCKRNSPEYPVRVGVVREVLGSMNIHNATAAAIFTTSYFTKPAVDEAAKLRYRLSLNDYFEIMQSIARHQRE